MFIRRGTAGKIIDEISKVVDYDINIMDEEGLIIASTNPCRINTFHEAAYRIIKDNLKELIVYRDGEYEGCRKGINLPIYFDSKIIGVIGITGEVSEILGYGKIIKKMTEILVLDLFTYHKRNMAEQSRLIFVTELINGNLSENQVYIEEELKKYNLSAGGNFVVAIINAPDIPKTNEGEEFTNQSIEKYIVDIMTIKGTLAILSSGMIIMIIKCESVEDAKRILLKPLGKLQMNVKDRLICSLGSSYMNYDGIPQSYKEAMRVMRLKEAEGDGMYCFDEEIIDILLEDTPVAYKSRCVINVFKNCTQDEADDFSNFIIIYFRNSGSIKAIAERLFIHKNTVQYKINKIKTKTGLDVREMEDLQTLMIAAKWYSSGISKQ